MQETTNICTN